MKIRSIFAVPCALLLLAHLAAASAAAGDGALDTAFNGTGEVAVLSGTAGGGDVQVLAQPDGGVVLVGTTSPLSRIGATRLHADGSSDASFGTNGLATVALPSGSSPDNVVAAIDSAGRIVVGATADFGSHTLIFVARLTSGGQPDSTFNGAGTLAITRTFITSQGDRVSGIGVFSDPVAAAADDMIFVAGSMQDAYGSGNSSSLAVIPLNSDGSYTDNVNIGNGTFFFGGVSNIARCYRTAIPGGAGFDTASAIARRWYPGSSSELVAVAGNAYSLGNVPNFSAVFELDGSLHAVGSFGFSGYSTFVFASVSGTSLVSAIALDDANRVIVAGTDTSTAHNSLAVARILTTGLYDTTFNGNGRAIVNFDESGNMNYSSGQAVLVQHDGKVLIGGQIQPSTWPGSGTLQFGLVRLTAGGVGDATFTGGTTIAGARKYVFSAGNDYAYSMAFTQGEKVLLGGIVNQPSNEYGVLRATNDHIFGDGADPPAYLPRIP